MDDDGRRGLRQVPLMFWRLVASTIAGLLLLAAVIADSETTCLIASVILLCSALAARDLVRIGPNGPVVVPGIHGASVAVLIVVPAAAADWAWAAWLAGAAGIAFTVQVLISMTWGDRRKRAARQAFLAELDREYEAGGRQ
ncbi:hypothetical protein K8Z61_10775 [Nocardioides sp. TRM66260-LWL]|uniref:hypothetical protein n=1 Tax=Nocardioides sp. TRM66260-LWL TaxID=2874478 RepID=UPI001CC56A67|nr:hypothetical protein [Nocardioides sp. TRM66260-LWL]MBZ5734981.1 hypothetical protein [Nocardioides sp. TRM66260-LWL]